MTRDEIRKLPTGIELDRLIAIRVMRLTHLPGERWMARDGCMMGGGYEAYNKGGRYMRDIPPGERVPSWAEDEEPVRPFVCIYEYRAVGYDSEKGETVPDSLYHGWSPSRSLDLAMAAAAGVIAGSDGWSRFQLAADRNGWRAGWWMSGGGHGEPASGWRLSATAETPALAVCRFLALNATPKDLPAGVEYNPPPEPTR